MPTAWAALFFNNLNLSGPSLPSRSCFTRAGEDGQQARRGPAHLYKDKLMSEQRQAFVLLFLSHNRYLADEVRHQAWSCARIDKRGRRRFRAR